MKNFMKLFPLLIGLILPALSFSQTDVKEDLQNMRNGQSIQFVAQKGSNNLRGCFKTSEIKNVLKTEKFVVLNHKNYRYEYTAKYAKKG